MEIATIRTDDDVAAMAERIYGDQLGPVDHPRVLHPTAVWDRGGDPFVTLEINAATPKSAHDFFVLNLSRARADAIVTTGLVLRREGALSHELQGPGRVGAALAAWRRSRLGLETPPISLVLTSGRGLDWNHPLFHGPTRPLVYTSHEEARGLADGCPDGVEVVGRERPDLRDAIAWLAERGASTISIEAGPSTSRALYESDALVDELLLSVYEAPELDPRVKGGVFLTPTRIAECFELPRGPFRPPQSPWTIARYLRRGFGAFPLLQRHRSTWAPTRG